MLHTKFASYSHAAFTGHITSVPFHPTALSRLDTNPILGTLGIFIHTVQRIYQGKRVVTILLNSILLFGTCNVYFLHPRTNYKIQFNLCYKILNFYITMLEDMFLIWAHNFFRIFGLQTVPKGTFTSTGNLLMFI